jgi:hypothetical protein
MAKKVPGSVLLKLLFPLILVRTHAFRHAKNNNNNVTSRCFVRVLSVCVIRTFVEFRDALKRFSSPFGSGSGTERA